MTDRYGLSVVSMAFSSISDTLDGAIVSEEQISSTIYEIESRHQILYGTAARNSPIYIPPSTSVAYEMLMFAVTALKIYWDSCFA